MAQAPEKVGQSFQRERDLRRILETAPLLAGYGSWMTAKGYKPRGAAEKLTTARAFMDYLTAAGLSVKDVGVREAEGYRDSLRLSGGGHGAYKASTVNVVLSNLRNFWRYLVSGGIATGNPFLAARRLREGRGLPRAVPTLEQMAQLFATLSAGRTREELELWVTVEILYGTGMRINEVEKLTTEDFRDGAVRLRDDKERQDRLVPLPEIAAHLLSLYCRFLSPARGAFFARSRSRTFARWVDERLAKLSHELAIPHLSCHSLRYACAIHLFNAGADLRQVQALLGHRRLKTTEGYTRLATQDLKEVLEAHHPRERAS